MRTLFCSLALLTGCTTTQGIETLHSVKDILRPTINHYQDVTLLENESIAGRTNYVVALIPNFHWSYECQERTYQVMSSHIKNTRFVAREYKTEETKLSHFYNNFVYYEHQEDAQQNLVPAGSFSDFANLPLEKRVATVSKWIETHSYPTEGVFPSEDGKKVASPTSPATWIKGVYQDEVAVYGVEDKDSLARADHILLSMHLNGTNRKSDYRKVLRIRDRAMTKKLVKLAKELEKGGIVFFPLGVAHVNGVAHQLTKRRVSHLIIEIDACVPQDVFKHQ